MNSNLFEIKYFSNLEDYFIVLKKFAIHLSDIGLIFEEEKKLLNNELNYQNIRLIDSLKSNYEEINIGNEDFSQQEVIFIVNYLIPSLLRNGFRQIIFESDKIHLDCFDELTNNRKENLIFERTIYCQLEFQDLMKEIIRLKCINGLGDICLSISGGFNTEYLKCLNNDKRLYRDIIDIIMNYAIIEETFIKLVWC
jgi:hypothetical protein